MNSDLAEHLCHAKLGPKAKPGKKTEVVYAHTVTHTPVFTKYVS